METASLNKSVALMDFLMCEDEKQKQKLIRELSHAAQIVGKKYIDPFSQELNKNLLEKETNDSKRDILKHYIDEFSRAEFFFEKEKNIFREKENILDDFDEYGIHQSLKNSQLSDFYIYVLVSYYIFNAHFYDIQNCCRKYKIDFFDICRELHFKWDLIDTKITLEYRQTENHLLEKSKKFKIEPFPHYIKKNSAEVSSLCKEIFNNNISPKEYAIMFCLLTDKGLIEIPNKSRKKYYIAWYNFIDVPLPKNENFYAINKYIVDKALNGLVFQDETDNDYVSLRATFEKALLPTGTY